MGDVMFANINITDDEITALANFLQNQRWPRTWYNWFGKPPRVITQVLNIARQPLRTAAILPEASALPIRQGNASATWGEQRAYKSQKFTPAFSSALERFAMIQDIFAKAAKGGFWTWLTGRQTSTQLLYRTLALAQQTALLQVDRLNCIWQLSGSKALQALNELLGKIDRDEQVIAVALNGVIDLANTDDQKKAVKTVLMLAFSNKLNSLPGGMHTLLQWMDDIALTAAEQLQFISRIPHGNLALTEWINHVSPPDVSARFLINKLLPAMTGVEAVNGVFIYTRAQIETHQAALLPFLNLISDHTLIAAGKTALNNDTFLDLLYVKAKKGGNCEAIMKNAVAEANWNLVNYLRDREEPFQTDLTPAGFVQLLWPNERRKSHPLPKLELLQIAADYFATQAQKIPFSSTLLSAAIHKGNIELAVWLDKQGIRSPEFAAGYALEHTIKLGDWRLDSKAYTDIEAAGASPGLVEAFKKVGVKFPSPRASSRSPSASAASMTPRIASTETRSLLFYALQGGAAGMPTDSPAAAAAVPERSPEAKPSAVPEKLSAAVVSADLPAGAAVVGALREAAEPSAAPSKAAENPVAAEAPSTVPGATGADDDSDDDIFPFEP